MFVRRPTTESPTAVVLEELCMLPAALLRFLRGVVTKSWPEIEEEAGPVRNEDAVVMENAGGSDAE